MFDRIKARLRDAAEMGKFKRLMDEVRGQARGFGGRGSDAVLELAALLATRPAIADVLAKYGLTRPAAQAKLVEMHNNLLMGGAGQWAGPEYVPTVALYDPELLEILLSA